MDLIFRLYPRYLSRTKKKLQPLPAVMMALTPQPGIKFVAK